jgi:hypothetical protein
VAQLGPGTACCGWNHCGRRLAAGAIDGSVSVYDSQPSPSSRWQVSFPHHRYLLYETLNLTWHQLAVSFFRFHSCGLVVTELFSA